MKLVFILMLIGIAAGFVPRCSQVYVYTFDEKLLTLDSIAPVVKDTLDHLTEVQSLVDQLTPPDSYSIQPGLWRARENMLTIHSFYLEVQSKKKQTHQLNLVALACFLIAQLRLGYLIIRNRSKQAIVQANQ